MRFHHKHPAPYLRFKLFHRDIVEEQVVFSQADGGEHYRWVGGNAGEGVSDVLCGEQPRHAHRAPEEVILDHTDVQLHPLHPLQHPGKTFNNRRR